MINQQISKVLDKKSSFSVREKEGCKRQKTVKVDQSGSARAILGAMSDKLPPSLPQGELGRFRRGPSWRRMFKSKEAAAQHRKDKLPLDMTAGERMEAYGPSPGSPTQRTMMFSSQRGAMMHGVPVLPNSPPPGGQGGGAGAENHTSPSNTSNLKTYSC